MIPVRSTLASILADAGRLAFLAALVVCATALSVWLTWTFWQGLGWPLWATVATVGLLEGSLTWLLGRAAGWLVSALPRVARVCALLVGVPLALTMGAGSFLNSASGLAVASHAEAETEAAAMRAADPRIPALEAERAQMQQQRARLVENAASERARGFYRYEREALSRVADMDAREAEIAAELAALQGLASPPPQVAPHFEAVGAAAGVSGVALAGWWALGFAGLLEWLKLVLLLEWHLARGRAQVVLEDIPGHPRSKDKQPIIEEEVGDIQDMAPVLTLVGEGPSTPAPRASQDNLETTWEWTETSEDIYRGILPRLLAGEVKPTMRSLKGALRCGDDMAEAIRSRLVSDGYATRAGRGRVRLLEVQRAAMVLE